MNLKKKKNSVSKKPSLCWLLAVSHHKHKPERWSTCSNIPFFSTMCLRKWFFNFSTLLPLSDPRIDSHYHALQSNSMGARWECSPLPGFVNPHKPHLSYKGWHCQGKGSSMTGRYCGKVTLGENCYISSCLCESICTSVDVLVVACYCVTGRASGNPHGKLLMTQGGEGRGRKCEMEKQQKDAENQLGTKFGIPNISSITLTLFRYPPFIPHYKKLPTHTHQWVTCRAVTVH